MYPAHDLKKLELRKLRARLSILKHRQQCIIAGRQLQGTVATAELWRKRAVEWGGMLKFAPGVFGVFRGLKMLFGRHAAPKAGEGEPARGKTGKVSTVISWLTTGLRAYNTFKR